MSFRTATCLLMALLLVGGVSLKHHVMHEEPIYSAEEGTPTASPTPGLPAAMPLQVNIGGQLYTVEVRALMPDGEEGEINYDTKVIMIDSQDTEDQRRHCLWHEIEHGAVHLHRMRGNALELEEHPQPLDEDTWIESQAGEMVEVVRDNPQLMKWLAAAGNGQL